MEIMSDDLNSILQLGEVLESKLSVLEDKLEEQINKIVDLSRMGAVITSVLNLDLVLPMIVETALSLVKGEVGLVVLFDRDGREKSVSWGLSREVIAKLKAPNGEEACRYIRRTGESLIINGANIDFMNDTSRVTTRLNSFIGIALKTQSKIIGAIAIANKEGEDSFNDDDKFALETLGNFAAVAVTNADLHHEALQKQKYESELDMASQVQSMLMPEKELFFDGLRVHTYNAQAAQVGGDFYDIIEVQPGKYLAVVADVSNKGIPAALIMASVQAYIRLAAESIQSPAELAAKINTRLCLDASRLNSVFVTMFLGLVDLKTHSITCSICGHPPALLLRHGTVIRINSGGTFLGQFSNALFTEEKIGLERGDRLVVFTDGLFECVNDKGQMLGIDNVESFLRQNISLPWGELLGRLKDLLKVYSYDEGRVDDTTIMIIEVLK